jgi:hypothetical protein
MLELREESAPRTMKSFPIKPTIVSWPAADDASAAVRKSVTNAKAMSAVACKFIRLVVDVDAGDCCGSGVDVISNLENDTMFLCRDGRPCACIGWSFMMMEWNERMFFVTGKGLYAGAEIDTGELLCFISSL